MITKSSFMIFLNLKMLLFIVLFQYFTFSCIAATNIPRLKAASSPIILNLQPKPSKHKNGTVNTSNYIKSQPELFQYALGIEPNETFTMNFDSWIDLKNSGLFSNLSAKPYVKNNQIYLEISGIELPSTDFAPEVSVKDVSNRPDFAGGIMYNDRNFLGLGQQVEAIISKKEGRKALADLPASFRLLWKDSSFGKASRLSVGMKEEHNLENVHSIRPLFDDQSKSCNMPMGERVHTIIRKIDMKWKWIPKYLNKQVSVDLEPYYVTLDGIADKVGESKSLSLYPINMNGVVSTLTFKTKLGHSIMGWIDQGFTRFNKNRASIKSLSNEDVTLRVDNNRQDQYQQYGFDLTSPDIFLGKIPKFSIKLPRFRLFGSKLAKDNSSTITITKSSPIQSTIVLSMKPVNNSMEQESLSKLPIDDNGDQYVNVFGKYQYKVMRSFGQGRIPLYHHVKVYDSHMGRGIPATLNNQPVEFKDEYPIHSEYAATKLDIYFEGISSSFRPGLFTDLVFFKETINLVKKTSQSTTDDIMRRAVTIGVSVRVQGLRLDVGWPITGEYRPRVYLGLDL